MKICLDRVSPCWDSDLRPPQYEVLDSDVPKDHVSCTCVCVKMYSLPKKEFILIFLSFSLRLTFCNHNISAANRLHAEHNTALTGAKTELFREFVCCLLHSLRFVCRFSSSTRDNVHSCFATRKEKYFLDFFWKIKVVNPDFTYKTFLTEIWLEFVSHLRKNLITLEMNVNLNTNLECYKSDLKSLVVPCDVLREFFVHSYTHTQGINHYSRWRRLCYSSEKFSPDDEDTDSPRNVRTFS